MKDSKIKKQYRKPEVSTYGRIHVMTNTTTPTTGMMDNPGLTKTG